jgi:plasmid stability protein
VAKVMTAKSQTGTPSVLVVAQVPEQLKAALVERARVEDRSLSSLVRQALRARLETEAVKR